MGVSSKNKSYESQNLNWWINKKSGNVQIYPRIQLNKLYNKSHGSGTIGQTWKKHHDLFFNLLKSYLKGNICEIGGGQNSIVNKVNDFSKIERFICFDRNLRLKKKNHKIKKIHTFFNKNYFKNKLNYKIDLLVHSHTFEHLYDPNKFLKDIRSVLSKNGKHIFSVPNMKSMVQKGYANAMNFEHPFYCDEKLINYLLIKNNFKIVKKKYFKKDHSIMYVTKIDHQKITEKRPDIEYYSEYKKNLNLFKKTFNNWIIEINKINKIINKYQNVFIFGAHIFSQMMLFNGLNKKKIIGILDNDKQKMNKFLYGTDIKIYNPLILKKVDKPCIILKAGSYNKEIKKQLMQINSKVIIV